MKLTNTAIALAAALALAAGCGKKKTERNPAPGTGSAVGTGSGSGSGTAVGAGSGTATPGPAPLTGVALAKAYLAGWDAWNAGDKAAFRAQYADDASSHWPDQPNPERKGGDAITDEAFGFRAGFPDAKATAQLVLVNGRTVAAVWLTTGTNSAAMKTPMGEMPPTNKPIGQLLFHTVTFDDANKVADEWFIMDGNTMAAQLGLSPMPGRPVIAHGAAAPVIVVSTGDDLEKANLSVTQKGNEDFNKHDADAIALGLADDAVESDQSAPADVTGKDQIMAGTRAFLGAFSDGKVTPLTLWAAGDFVVQISRFTGTNDGDLGPMKKTGKPVQMTIAEISKIEKSKVKQVWRFFNSGAMAMQLGMVPAAPASK